MASFPIFRPTYFLLLLPFVWLHYHSAQGILVNRTIDDTYGDSVTGLKPLYFPSTAGIWAHPTWQDCLLKPDPARAYNQTFSAATGGSDGRGFVSATFSFNGELETYLHSAWEEGTKLNKERQSTSTSSSQRLAHQVLIPMSGATLFWTVKPQSASSSAQPKPKTKISLTTTWSFTGKNWSIPSTRFWWLPQTLPIDLYGLHLTMPSIRACSCLYASVYT